MSDELAQLRDTAQYLDASLVPTLNELPALFAASVYGADEGVAQAIKDGRDENKDFAEIRQDVSHAISPPQPDAQAAGTNADQAQLQDDLAQLRAQVDSLSQQGGSDLNDHERQELEQLRELSQQLSVERATSQSQHTATSEPVPDQTPPPVGPAPTEATS